MGLLLALGVVGVALVRLLCRPIQILDPEHTMVATAGREWAHGHLHEIAAYQVDIYQGAFLVDGLLAALGFKLLGDHPMAWWWVPLLYLLGIAATGMLLLRRVAGGRAAIAWALLLMSAPFVVKDGLLSATGGHAPGIFFVLLATWLALGKGALRPLLAGAALGFGVWYIRSAAAVLPAVALASLWQGRRRALGWFAAGLALFPLLLAANALLLSSGRDDSFVRLAAQATFGMRSDGFDVGALPAKVGESLSLHMASALYGPAGPIEEAPRWLQHASGWTGLGWAAAWVAALLLAALRLRRRLSRPTRDLAAVAVALLPLAYAAAYVLGPFRIEEVVRGWYPLTPTSAPEVTNVRYLVPILLLWMLLVSLEFAGSSNSKGRSSPGLRVVVLLGLAGLSLAAVGPKHDRAPPGSFVATAVVRYGFLYGPHRGPSRESHASCDTSDPISRAAHLRAVGAFGAPIAKSVGEDPRLVKAHLARIRKELDLEPQELAFVVEGLGMALGDQLRANDSILVEDLAASLERAVTELHPDWVRPFVLGVGNSIANSVSASGMPPEQFTVLVCSGSEADARPLCFLAGLLLSSRKGMDALDVVHEQPMASIPAVERALLRGYAMQVGGRQPPGAWPKESDIADWPRRHRVLFQQGLRTGARRRWRLPAEPEFRPSRMP